MKKDFENAFIAGVSRVAAWADLLDQINVFPIADGDTGRNLIISLTPILQLKNNIKEITRNLMLSARGNSGNIAVSFFSEFLKTDSLESLPITVKKGMKQAWQAVNEPRSGTMLTLFDALVEILDSDIINTDKQWINHVLNHLENAVSSTTELIPKLKEADVVDAGALGMFIYLDGFFTTLNGNIDRYRPINEIFKDKLKISSSFSEKNQSGYCIDIALRIKNNLEDASIDLGDYSENVVSNSEKGFVKLHLHTDNKEDLKKKLENYGDIVRWSYDDLGAQIEDFCRSDSEQAIHIMTDAAGSVTREDSQRLGITLLDSYITFGNSCVPETHIAPLDLYEAMKNGVKVSTSQASVFERHQLYESVLSLHSKVLYLCVGSVYTGNYDVVTEWKKENDPYNRMTVIDSSAASGRLGTIVISTARFSQKTSNSNEVIKFAKWAIDRCQEYVFLDKLHYLAAGGRLSKTSAFFGDMFNMKPIISPLAEGATKVGVVRNHDEQLKFLFAKLEDNLTPSSEALIMLEFSNNQKWVNDIVKTQIKERYPNSEIILHPLSLTSGAHMGPETWAVAFLPEIEKYFSCIQSTTEMAITPPINKEDNK
ncbi:MAG: DegV family protein [Spirochaetota bacterium]|nr:DegV family protein [Spirochaetota bacterium]